MKKINTVRFGEIEIPEEKIIHFADGMPAFEGEHDYVIVPFDESSPYVFLQSVKTPELAFLITMPFVFFPDYEFQLEDDIAEKMGLKSPDDMLIYTLITIPDGNIKEMTANLMAPVVINKATNQARQIVLDRGKYTTKHRLFPAKEDM
ncbi:MAG: flagellar assembly protein FliW [Schwartzia sp.]|nr:flagellar assembly protein FliW [Schwartzia sp. (in: firmicutes)]